MLKPQSTGIDINQKNGQMLNTQSDKLLASCLGAALGESFGMPVEGLTSAEINKIYGEVETILPRQESDVFQALPAGSTAKQTEALLAILNASNPLPELQEFAFNIKDAYNRQQAKWPRSTTFPWPPFPDGGHYSLAFAIPAAWLYFQNRVNQGTLETWLKSLEPVSPVWQQSVWVYLRMLDWLFDAKPQDFDRGLYLKSIYQFIEEAENQVPHDSKLREKMQQVEPLLDESVEEIGKACGGVDVAAENILVFALSMLYRNPDSYEKALLEAANAGGATEAATFYLGSLLGALHGQEVFPATWLDKFSEQERIISEVERYRKKVGI
ncbi:MAG: ADP-ribosylglycohydrolase family protein [Balneolales bacterium]